MRKVRVGILFGGQSAEHEVSIQSALSIMGAIDRAKYEVIPIGIDKNGAWHHLEEEDVRALREAKGLPSLPASTKESLLARMSQMVDVVFPALHGPLGEDGTVQGALELEGIPYVGSGVLGSAVSMDKDVMKRLFREANLPIARFLVITRQAIDIDTIVEALGIPLFVKPANMGSSVGITKVKEKGKLQEAIEEALLYDTKVVIEEAICGREIECSVLGNASPIASLPGEVIPHREFYSYEAKYVDADGASFVVPAQLDEETVRDVQKLSVEAFKTLCCEGMARVDFFFSTDGKLFVNEVNTIPGFTKISLYPRLWQASGIGYEQLVDELLQLAITKSRMAPATSVGSPL